MSKKIYMYFLVIAFALGGILIIILYRNKFSSSSTSLPLPRSEPTATPTSSLPVPTVPPQLIEVEKDLKMIETDLQKIKEEKRLEPPTFIFELGIGNR